MCVALWGHTDNLLQLISQHYVLINYTPYSKVWRIFFYFLKSTCKGEKTPSGATQTALTINLYTMRMLIIRTAQNQHQTIGTGLIFDNLARMLFEFQTLELPFLNNKVGVSCIPFGKYKVEKRQSDRFGSHFHVKDVEGRSMILIHLGNYHRNTSGCVLVGSEHKYLDNDNCLDVIDSRLTMKKLVEIMPTNFDLTITDFINNL